MSDLPNRLKSLRKHLGKNQKEFAALLGLTGRYIGDLERGTRKGKGYLFWEAVQKSKPHWLPYLQGQLDTLPPEHTQMSIPGTRDEIAHIDDRRLFNRKARLTEEDCEALAEWLGQDEEARDLLVGWAKARAKDSFQDSDSTRLVEFLWKAMAFFLLQKQEEELKEKVPGG